MLKLWIEDDTSSERQVRIIVKRRLTTVANMEWWKIVTELAQQSVRTRGMSAD